MRTNGCARYCARSTSNERAGRFVHCGQRPSYSKLLPKPTTVVAVRMSPNSDMLRSSAIWQSSFILIAPPDEASRRLFEATCSKKSGTKSTASIEDPRQPARLQQPDQRPSPRELPRSASELCRVNEYPPLVSSRGSSRFAIGAAAFPLRGRRHDFGLLLIVSGAPPGDGIRDDLGRGRSHFGKPQIMHHLSLNPLPFRLQKIFRLSQLSNPSFDFRNRGGGQHPDERRHTWLSSCLPPKHDVRKIANFPFNSQTCGDTLEARNVKLHGLLMAS